jgi:lipopolysaccharide biosynthesis regulator YciM
MSIRVNPSGLVDPKVKEILDDLASSGSSEAFAVAECLSEISQNATQDDDDQAQTDTLIASAQEIINAAKHFVELARRHGEGRFQWGDEFYDTLESAEAAVVGLITDTLSNDGCGYVEAPDGKQYAIKITAKLVEPN